MRLKKILAVALGATLAVSMATALTACSDDPESAPTPAPAPTYTTLGTSSVEYNIDDYMPPAEEGNVISNSKPAFTSAVKLTVENVTLVSSAYSSATSNGFAILRNTDDDKVTYSVYSANAEKFIVSGLETEPTTTSYSNAGVAVGVVIASKNNEESITENSYIAADGTKLLDYGDYRNISGNVLEMYVNGEQKKSKVLLVSGYEIKDSVYTGVNKYFIVKVDAKSGAIQLTAVNENNVSETPAENKYLLGSYVDTRIPVYASTEEKPVNGDIADYSYVKTSNSYIFYKSNERTGSVTLDYGKALGFVGNYMYYKTETPAYRESTGGFNYVIYTGENKEVIDKYNYRLFKYDIVNDSTTELSYSVKIDSFSARYNYTAKAYDAAEIDYYDMTDGKFIKPVNDDVYKTAIVDAELNVVIDLDQKAGEPISKLKDNRYLATGTSNGNFIIVDKNLDYVTEASSKYDIYQNEGIIKFRVDGKYGLIDYDGKIKVEPVYNNIGDFYGDYAYASRTVKGKTEYFFIDKNGKVTAAPKSDVESGKEVDVRSNYYRVVTPNKEEPGSTVDFYTFDGTHLVKLENITNTYSITVNGKLIIADGVCYALKY